jgi:uncharacterized protein
MEKILTQKIKDVIVKEDPRAQIILYGSRARGNFSKESDWDILVLLDRPQVSFKDEQSIRHKLFDLEMETGESISTFVYSLSDWNTKLSVTPLYKNVKKEGIYL